MTTNAPQFPFDPLNNPVLRAIFNQASDAMLIANGHGYFIVANSTACQLLDCTQEELEQMTILDIIPNPLTEWPARFAQAVNSTLIPEKAADIFTIFKQEGLLKFETNYRRSNRSECPLAGTVEYLADREHDFFLVVLWDLSERKEKQIEVTVQASEAHFRNVLENVQLIAIMLDISGSLVFCNDYFLELTGWNREEALGQNWL